MAVSRRVLCLAVIICCLALLPGTESGRSRRRSRKRQPTVVHKTKHFYDHLTKYYPTYVARYVPVPSPYYVPFPVHVGGGHGGRDNLVVLNSGGSKSGSNSGSDEHGGLAEDALPYTKRRR